MATVTIRNLPEETVAEMRATAQRNGRSLEAEIRLLLQQRYRSRDDVLTSIRKRWTGLPRVSSRKIDTWIEVGRR
jgi:plasmid stability protein